MHIDSIYESILVSPTDSELEAVMARYNVQERFDNFDEQLEELYEVMCTAESHAKDAALYKAFATKLFGENLATAGMWAIYPWAYRAVRIMPKEHFINLRTARNRNIITAEEQQSFLTGVVGVAGLSVGSSITTTLALIGGVGHIKIADFDTLAITNMNRISTSVTNLGLAKSVIAARRIFEINPYATVEIFNDGLTEQNIDAFFGGSHPLDVLFDEIDNLKIKIDLRLKARDEKVPVLMITDNGDNIMIDIERFDQGVTSLFHGRLEEAKAKELFAAPSIDPQTRAQLTLQIIGAESGVPRMQDSLVEVGKTLPSWPQLGTATTLAGATGAYLARKIILKEPLMSGRTHLSLDATFIPEYTGEQAVQERATKTQQFVERLRKR